MARSATLEKSMGGGRLFPADDDKQKRLVSWCLDAFGAAESARRQYEDRWERYYKLYRSYQKREKTDWRSKVFVPIAFWVVETITPQLVAQLPRFVVKPHGADDVEPAREMEELLDWAINNSQPSLYVELVKQTKWALMFGTGILKSRYITDYKIGHRRVQVTKPVYREIAEEMRDPQGNPMLDLDGNPMTERREVLIGESPAGYRTEPYSFVAYDGPVAEWVDNWDFWPAPEAPDVESARYVIQRAYRTMPYIMRRVEEGAYRLPEGMKPEDLANIDNEALATRLGSVGLAGDLNDPTRKAVELLEYWTDDGRVITLANRKAVIRHSENPFDHAEKPYHRVVDHLVPGEFWGIGEVEALEGLQDLQNAIVNQRVDNVRMVMDAMLAVSENELVDLRDLRRRPGGVIRVKGQSLPQEVVQSVKTDDVTSSAYTEAEYNERLIEKVTGVSGFQQGVTSPADPDTATGSQLIYQGGQTRFGLKTRLAELMGMKSLARQFGSMLQQFTETERVVMVMGEDGAWVPRTFDPARLHGALDYDIEVASLVQSEGMKRQMALSLLQVLASYLPPDPLTGGPGTGVLKLVEDVLRAYDKKDLGRYLGQPPPPMMDPSMMDPAMAAQLGAGLGEPGGRQEYGQPTPPGAMPINQSAVFGPPYAGSSQQSLFRALGKELNTSDAGVLT